MTQNAIFIQKLTLATIIFEITVFKLVIIAMLPKIRPKCPWMSHFGFRLSSGCLGKNRPLNFTWPIILPETLAGERLYREYNWNSFALIHNNFLAELGGGGWVFCPATASLHVSKIENCLFLQRCKMFELHHLPMHFTPIIRKTSLVFPESNSYSLNVAEKTKSSEIWPQLIALERKAKNDDNNNNNNNIIESKRSEFVISSRAMRARSIWTTRCHSQLQNWMPYLSFYENIAWWPLMTSWSSSVMSWSISCFQVT